MLLCFKHYCLSPRICLIGILKKSSCKHINPSIYLCYHARYRFFEEEEWIRSIAKYTGLIVRKLITREFYGRTNRERDSQPHVLRIPFLWAINIKFYFTNCPKRVYYTEPGKPHPPCGGRIGYSGTIPAGPRTKLHLEMVVDFQP